MNVTLGGDRLGSGNKNKQHLHNYYRSTHNLSQDWISPMTVGALYPFLVIPAMRNDKFDIKLNADTITVPTTGPLFGSFKLQIDLFQCPIRLYQAILHNNPTNIGLKMNQVMLPTYELTDTYSQNVEHIKRALNNSCLWKYLGLSGIGRGSASGANFVAKRAINAVPMLAYYDIFKNYYSNKQEENAYVIGGDTEEEMVTYISPTGIHYDGNDYGPEDSINVSTLTIDDNVLTINYDTNAVDHEPANIENIKTSKVKLFDSGGNLIEETTWENIIAYSYNVKIILDEGEVEVLAETGGAGSPAWVYKIRTVAYIQCISPNYITTGSVLKLNPFKLKNIDDMRMAVLSAHTLGTPFKVSEQNYLPYNINTHEKSMLHPLNGLVVKTYQSDLFNNWINTEWIDGENGIAEITKIATSDGAFKIDQLNLAEKLYNMLNRVAVSGGTYEDWQDAVYDQAPHKHIESPIYLGGMSSEVVFEQVTSTAAAGEEPLGTLAGKGKYLKRKGGHVTVKCDEASFIIGIVSLTPRIKYNQGNEFYLTELQSLDDLHKPALDGIGFQNLLGERLLWTDTQMKTDGTIYGRSTIGKVPAWIEYMTAVDKTFGDFANTDGKAFMVLNRNYEANPDGTIRDATTYIDPTKYNYVFKYTNLDAQNFWTEIYSNITARRKMSAKQIPNI